MPQFLLWSCCAWVGVLLAATCSYADEVQLNNGDRLTGDVVKMEDKVIIFKTDYGGEIRINWDQVTALTSTKPMVVKVLADVEDRLRELLLGEYELIETTKLGPGGTVPMTDVKAINLGHIRFQGTTFTLGGNSTSGNTDTKAVNVAGRLMVRSDRQRLYLEAKYNYGEAKDAVTVRNSMAQANYDYFITKKVFLNAMSLFEKDTFQSLQLRTTLGAGVGYQFFDTDRTTLSTSIGLGYVNEHFTTVPQTETASSRWSVRFRYAIIPDRVTLFHRQDGFYDLGEGNAIRLSADQGLRVFVYQDFYFNVEYDVRLNTQPAPGRQQLDEAFIFGIGYEFR
ncbi:MAG: DUF481 domain-containing protein [Nitrospiraceae bacterium]